MKTRYRLAKAQMGRSDWERAAKTVDEALRDGVKGGRCKEWEQKWVDVFLRSWGIDVVLLRIGTLRVTCDDDL